jgi:transcriptional regulator GlxA family with amidase domain
MDVLLNVGILIFNEVEVLDFAGPFEVFSLCENPVSNAKLFSVFTVSEHDAIIKARNGLSVKANYTFSNCPDVDILIIPGGYGAEKIEIRNKTLLEWISKKAITAEIVCSVCTGAFLLAESAVVTKGSVTTHWMDIDSLQSSYPDLNVVKNKRFVDQGKVITSGGISAGIDMSLYVVRRLFDESISAAAAKRMEYNWNTSSGE